MPSRLLADLRPNMQQAVRDWLAECEALGHDVLVYCTYRSPAEQAMLYAKGRTTPGPKVTNARPGQSAHNWGLALDFVPMINGKAQWRGGNPLYLETIAIAERHGLESLCRSSFPEWAHLQWLNWKLEPGVNVNG